MALGVSTGDRINEGFYYSGRNDEVTVRRGSTVYPTRAIDGNLGLYLRWEIKTLYIELRGKTFN